MNHLDKKGQVALVTGATAGIGEATAWALAALGYKILATGRREERLLKLQADMRNKNHDCDIFCFDVRDSKACENALEEIKKKHESLDVLVNNAGLALGKNPIESGLFEDWDTMMDTNVKGLMYMTQFAHPLLKKAKQGHIINIGSIAGKEVYPNGNIYCASKHAVDALTKSMRIEMVKDHIKVTGVCPGAAETEFSLVRFKGDEQTAKNIYKGLDALMAPDIAEAIVFAVTRPPHVNINDLVIMPTQQASATIFNRR